MKIYASSGGAEFLTFKVIEDTGRDLSGATITFALGTAQNVATEFLPTIDVPGTATVAKVLLGTGDQYSLTGSYVGWVKIEFGPGEDEVVIRQIHGSIIEIL